MIRRARSNICPTKPRPPEIEKADLLGDYAISSLVGPNSAVFTRQPTGSTTRFVGEPEPRAEHAAWRRC